jgi:DNA invertase Pin-like site-specific DNA recombinase
MPRTRKPVADASLAVAYIRVSTEDQHLGPEAQRAALEAWAARACVRLVAVCEDRGVSGAAQLEDRPGLQQALDALTAHGAGRLVVARRDRLGRDVVGVAALERLAERTGARVVSAAGEGEGDDPASQLMRRMVDAFAEYERELIRQRTKAALRAKRARGERAGNTPRGFSADAAGRLVPHQGEQEALTIIRALRGEGLTLREIAARLEARGIRNRAGRPYDAPALCRALRAA